MLIMFIFRFPSSYLLPCWERTCLPLRCTRVLVHQRLPSGTLLLCIPASSPHIFVPWIGYLSRFLYNRGWYRIDVGSLSFHVLLHLHKLDSSHLWLSLLLLLLLPPSWSLVAPSPLFNSLVFPRLKIMRVITYVYQNLKNRICRCFTQWTNLFSTSFQCLLNEEGRT